MGRTPELSFLELEAQYTDVERITQDIASATLPSDLNPEKAIDTLGGSIKIGKIVGLVDAVTPQNLIQFIPVTNARLSFGISAYGGLTIPDYLAKKMKELLKLRGLPISYIENHGKQFLDSVVVAKKNVFELCIFPFDKNIAVAKTVCVQKFEDWSHRDFGRPFADPKSGMLPPKVARMIVNIATKGMNTVTMLDPFCGMGTIVSEALLLGHTVIGSDYSEPAVRNAEQNITWLLNHYVQIKSSKYSFLVSDAVKISTKLKPESLDAIVTEPYLGKPTIGFHPEKVLNTIRGLEKLYIGCLRNWRSLLKTNGKVLIAFPSMVLGTREVTVKKPIDLCESLGYTKVLGPIEYSRAGASIKRHFYLFSVIN